MPVKKYNPITPGLRHRVGNDYSILTTDKPEKSLTTSLKKTGGRNSSGKMTMRNRGGGHKRRYRVIDFKRSKDEMSATVKTIEYDPIELHSLHWLSMEMGKKDISLLQMVCR